MSCIIPVEIVDNQTVIWSQILVLNFVNGIKSHPFYNPYITLETIDSFGKR